MSRIMTNVSSLIAGRILNQNNQALTKTLERLSTGYRINRGADDPAGLIASENLRGDIAAVRSALSNAERAGAVVSTAEAALAEISVKLTDLKELVTAAGNTGGVTQDEIDANQLQVDGIVASINRIASETSFQGMKLIDGSFNIIASATGGVDNVTDIEVRSFKQDSTTNKTLTVTLLDSASRAEGEATIAVGAGASTTWEVTGALGTAVFSFKDATQGEISAAINAMSATTGIIVSGNTLVSKAYGSDQFIRVKHIAGDDSVGLVATNGTDGTDASISINDVMASVKGYEVTQRTGTMDIKFRITEDMQDGTTTSEVITLEAGTGATFLLSPNIGLSGRENIGIPSVSGYHLGQQEYGFLSDITTGQDENLTDDPATALNIVDAAIKQVASLRGRLGSFINDTVESTMNALNIQLENVSAAESAIRDTDFAAETAALTRNQVLVSAGSSVLAIANAAPANVLSLLG